MSDPFVKITVGKTHFKSSVKRNTLSPEWNQEFECTVADTRGTVAFQVMDKDVVSDDALGNAAVALSSVPAKQAQVFALPLAKHHHKKQRTKGVLHVALWFTGSQAETPEPAGEYPPSYTPAGSEGFPVGPTGFPAAGYRRHE